MATGSAARCTAYTGPYGSLHQANVLITFISSSAGWIYPIDRFFGRTLYEYYYDIDFTDYADHEEIQKRNIILYESYCHLVGSLMINACIDYNIESTEIIRMIALVETKPELLGSISQCHFNYIRAVYGIDHFGYTMMRYCNYYKLMCCQDEMKITEANNSSNQMPNERHYLIYLLEVIESIGEKYIRADEIVGGHCLPLVEEMKAGPFVSPCGITLSDALQQHEYKSVISTFQDTNNLLKLAAHRLKQLDTMVEETSKENIPSDLVDVIAVLTRATMLHEDPRPPAMIYPPLKQLDTMVEETSEENIPSDLVDVIAAFTRATMLDEDPRPPAMISPPKQHLTKRTSSARLSNEEVNLDSTPAKRGSYQKDYLVAPPPSPKSKSHSPADSFKSSPSVKSKSHSPAESFKMSPNVKSKSCSPMEASTETMPDEFKEAIISPQLACELMQPSFQPIQYKALESLPNSDQAREEYLLHEYDRRLELHIAYNTMKFMTWNISENMAHGQLKPIIDNQAIFEQTWPLTRSENDPASLFRNVYTSTIDIADQEEGTGIKKLLQKAQLLIEQIQQTVGALKLQKLDLLT